MTTFQIIGLIVVALIGLYIFYCIYDLEKFNKKKKRRRKNKVLTVTLLFVALVAGENAMAWTGAGTQGNPYKITSTADMAKLADTVNRGIKYYSGTYFLLTTDLTYSYNYAWNSNNANATENNYTAIGAFGNSFKGHFDGGGHTISGIRIYKSGTSQTSDELQGVFGNLNGGSVRNLTVADASITGYQQVGAIAGCNNGTIEDCVVASNVGIYRVTNGADKHGGIIGANSNGNVRRCTSSATIITHPKIGNVINAKSGGIIGFQSQGQAVHHYVENNTALNVVVQSGQSVGGVIIGERYNSNTNYLHLTNNHYRNCTINGTANATNVGLGNPAGDMDGARSVHALTLGTDITATGESVVIGNTTYYASNTTITLGHNNSTGYLVTYRLNSNALSGNTFTMPNNDNGTVSATLTPITYYVRFDKNNDDATGTMGDQQFTYGQAQNLSANAFTREDYVFSGWNTQANGGGTSYTDGQSVSNLSTEPNGIVNLYAKWRLKLWQGSGTENDPYIINSTAALDLLAYAVNNNIDNNNGFTQKYFLQTANLTYNSTTNNYTPIGNDSRKFKGYYDGGGFTISGINVTGSDNYIGVFGHVSQGSIENVVVANSTFTGNNNVGGIVGHTYGGSVSNCKVMSDVTIGTSSSSANYHGGIVGYLREAEITGCLSMATLTDPNNVGSDYGGIAGSNSGTIKNCIYTGGSVTVHYHAAAIAIKNNQSSEFSNNYYFNCTVNGASAGVGIYYYDIEGACRAHTITLGENIALAGDQTTYSLSGLTAIDNAVLCHTVGSVTTILSGLFHAVTLSYTGTMPDGYSLVYNDGTDHLILGDSFIMPDADITVGISNAFLTIPGMGTENDPFIITSTDQLNLLAEMVNGISMFQNKYFKLGADISYDPNELTDGNNYTAIGIYYNSEYPFYYFDGTFDGDGHIISGIRINRPVNNPQALFGCVGPNGTVKNVTLIDAVIIGNVIVGGIVGDIRGTVENCRVINSNITGNSSIGGITGYSQCVTIENCIVLNTAIICNDNTISVGGAVFGVLSNTNINNNYYHNCTVNGVASNIGCGYGPTNAVWGSGDITMNNAAVQAYTLTLGEHLTATPAPAVTYNNINYYTEGTEVTLGTSAPAYTITSATLTYGGNNYNIVPEGGVYSFDMPAADATVTAQINIPAGLVESITVDPDEIEPNVGATYSIVFTVLPADATNKAVTFTSSDETVATVDADGNVTGVAAGTTTITIAATDGSGVTATLSVTVTNIDVEEINVDNEYITINTGDDDIITYQVLPAQATIHDVTFTSANTAVATVDEKGEVTGVGAGKTTITIASVSNPEVTASVEVSVYLSPYANQFTKGITGYGNDDNPGGWYLIASPLAAEVAPTDVTNMTNETFDLYRFNQAGANGEWENYKVHTEGFVLENGKGYLYANSENVPITFNGTPYSGDGTVTLAKTTGAKMEGWNLVGNPFTMNAYILDGRPFYIMNDEGSEIIAAAGNRNYIEPMEGIFVHADEDGETMTFTTDEPSKGRGQSSEPEQIVINLSTLTSQRSPSIIDRAIVRFDDGRQLPKLQIFENSDKLYIPQDGKEYAIAHCSGVGEMPLNFKAKKNGEYTLSVETANSQLPTPNCQLPTANYLHLIDNLTGADIDLLTTPSYTFTAKTTDYASRFKLVFANENDTENEDFAFISNGELIINGEGTAQVIDMLGHQLVSRQVSSDFRLPTSDFSAGVYVLRLVNGDRVKTQKIIIK